MLVKEQLLLICGLFKHCNIFTFYFVGTSMPVPGYAPAAAAPGVYPPQGYSQNTPYPNYSSYQAPYPAPNAGQPVPQQQQMQQPYQGYPATTQGKYTYMTSLVASPSFDKTLIQVFTPKKLIWVYLDRTWLV